MENENKCFFSISLENGITITGKNPEEVIEFLYDAHSAFFELIQYYTIKKLKNLTEGAITTMTQIRKAIETINHNYKHQTKQ